MKAIRIGCSGWNYQSWRGGEFYPKGCPPSRWLEHYSRMFDTVEVNSTFYRLASENAVANWIKQTPDDFVFALKASRYLTHVKRLTNLEQGIKRCYEAIAPLVGSPKLGPIVSATTRSRSSRSGRNGSSSGASAWRSTPTSTTTGRFSRRATRSGCANGSSNRYGQKTDLFILRGWKPVDRESPPT